MSAVKNSSLATAYVYDEHRGSWIACYPSRTFIEPAVQERRGRIRGSPPLYARGLSQAEVDASIVVILLMQVVSVVYLFVTMHLY